MHFSPEEKNNEMYSEVFMRFRCAYTKVRKLVKEYAPGGVNLGQTINVKDARRWSMHSEYHLVICIGTQTDKLTGRMRQTDRRTSLK